MTSVKFRILKILYKSTDRQINHIELLNKKTKAIMKNENAIDELIICGYIIQNTCSEMLTLTEKGIIEYEIEKKTRLKKIFNGILNLITIGLSIASFIKSFMC